MGDDGTRRGLRATAAGPGGPGLSRRAVLKMVAAAELGAAVTGVSSGRAAAAGRAWREAVAGYLERLARPDGGYAWEDQEGSHLSPTFAVIGCFRLLKHDPPDKARLADFVRTHHPSRWKKLEQEHREFEFQQIQGLLWLGEDASSFRELVRSWKAPQPYLRQYEQHAYPVFRFQLTAFTCRELLGLPLDDLSPRFVAYLDDRRRANGSFNNTPAADGGDGHVMNTWWGLQALRALGRAGERKDGGRRVAPRLPAPGRRLHVPARGGRRGRGRRGLHAGRRPAR